MLAIGNTYGIDYLIPNDISGRLGTIVVDEEDDTHDILVEFDESFIDKYSDEGRVRRLYVPPDALVLQSAIPDDNVGM